ncbi:MAG: aldehyde ferredoxin oxidoreductase family protein [Candidatus Helarchaeota archaeon]
MFGGCMGKIVSVDISKREIKEEKPGETFYRNFIGGIGIGVRYLYSNMRSKIDPLGPENILGFVSGLLNGTGLAYSGRYTVVGKSPLTGTWGDANSGGYFGLGLKKSGYDAIFIKGVSDTPVYLWIKNNKVEIRDASHLWGKLTHETDVILKKELEDKTIRVASIGPSGEKLSLISAIINDNGRAAARSGLGAVMGSKRLKAVVVSGDQKIPIANPYMLKKVRKKTTKGLKKKPGLLFKFILNGLGSFLPAIYRRGILKTPDYGTFMEMFGTHGTSAILPIATQIGDAPVKNWSGVGYKDFPMRTKANKISGEAMDKYLKKKFGCANCPLPCGAILEIDSKEIHRPEYETLASFGSMCLNDNIESIIEANYICNTYGLDTISAGAIIAFAIECYEKGILSKNETDGIELTWGNHEAIVQILQKIASRNGFGDILADGVKKAAEKIGKGAKQFAMHVHGQEIPMHDPRLSPSFATTYVTDPTPGRHTQGGLGYREFGIFYPHLEEIKAKKIKRRKYSGKGEEQAIDSKLVVAMFNSFGLCLFSSYIGPYPLIEAVKAVTGWNYTIDELLETGARIQTLRQAFNIREGFTPLDFKLPDRIKGIPPLPAGPSKNATIDLDSMVKEFYEEMRWNFEDGIPSKELLYELKLTDIVADLYSE